MSAGDFRSNERSVTMGADTYASSTSGGGRGDRSQERLRARGGWIIDATFMSKSALTAFLDEQYADAKEQGISLAPHEGDQDEGLDPIIFGRVLYQALREHQANRRARCRRQQWLWHLVAKIANLPDDQREIADIAAALERPSWRWST